jgi:hypothetical protein
MGLLDHFATKLQPETQLQRRRRTSLALLKDRLLWEKFKAERRSIVPSITFRLLDQTEEVLTNRIARSRRRSSSSPASRGGGGAAADGPAS